MNKSRITLAALAALAALPSLAQTAKPEPDYTLTANVGLFSDYRFRGFTQTDYNPAIQGGFDFTHKSGIYLGNWNSNVSSGVFNGAPIEMDFYGGWKTTWDDFGFDVGGIYYYYPGTGEYGPYKASNFEGYLGASWGPLSLKYSYAFTNFFGLDSQALGLPGNYNTKGSQYVDLSGNYTFDGGIGINGHVGYQYVKNGDVLGTTGNDAVWDYKVGVTYDWTGFILGLAVVGTSDKNFYQTAQNPPQGAGKTSVLVYVTRTF